MVDFAAPALRIAVLAAALAAVSGCLPIMMDRDGNWRDAEPSRPGFGNDLQPDADEPPAQ